MPEEEGRSHRELEPRHVNTGKALKNNVLGSVGSGVR